MSDIPEQIGPYKLDPDQSIGRRQITFVFNWFEELEQRVPTN